jgi:hypothetical protein
MRNTATLLTTTILIALTLAATTATTTSADPIILPEKAGRKYTSEIEKGTKPVLAGKNGEIPCNAGTKSGEFTGTTDLGPVTITFTGCKSGTTKCKSLGAAAEEVTFKGEAHLVTVLLAGVLGLGLLVLLPAALLHVECGILNILILGSVIGEATGLKTNTKVKAVTFNFARTGVTQAEKTCDEPVKLCEKAKFELKTEFGKGEEESAEEAKDIVIVEKGEAVEFHF